MDKDTQNTLLEEVSAVLLRCCLFTFALLCLWFAFYLAGGSLGYGMHSRWFQLSRHDYDLLNYFGMAFTKLCALLFFLFPFLSIRLVLRRRKKS